MKVELAPGKYVVAVSGGVDSMALLDMLAGQAGLELVVAHFDHGMRADSAADREFVGRAAAARNASYIYDEGHLGEGTSEATARTARYAFLERVRKEQNAQAIVTAHHQDDVLETAIINLLRGTGRKGLSALASRPDLRRPLLHVSKQEILLYAAAHNLEWREDSTNVDERYLRNYIRRRIVPRLGVDGRPKLLAQIADATRRNTEIDTLITKTLQKQHTVGGLDRGWFIMLPYALSLEVLAAWLRKYDARFDRPQLHRLTAVAKTARPGTRFDIDKTHVLQVGKTKLQLQPRSLLPNK